MLGLRWYMWNLYFPHIYVQFEGMVYQQIHVVEIPIGTDCAQLIADLFLYGHERNFMSNLHKSKQYDLINMFSIPLDTGILRYIHHR